jgi:ActR/RegA family two-component response regulator
MNSSWPWRQAKPAAPSLTEQLAAVMLKGKRVLFLDDDQNYGELVQGVAQRYEMKLVQVTTSGVARALIEADDQQFDAAILDVNVANGNGIALYRWLKETFPRLQVIFLTGLSVEDVAAEVHAIGSAPIYPKTTLWNAGFIEDLFERMGCRKKNPT